MMLQLNNMDPPTQKDQIKQNQPKRSHFYNQNTYKLKKNNKEKE